MVALCVALCEVEQFHRYARGRLAVLMGLSLGARMGVNKHVCMFCIDMVQRAFLHEQYGVNG